MSVPRTEAGQSYLEGVRRGRVGAYNRAWQAIPTIEAEARTAALADVRAAIEATAGEPCYDDGSDVCAVHSEVMFGGACSDFPWWLSHVLAAIDELAR